MSDAVVVRTAEALADLYEADETAWLDATAELIRSGRVQDCDLEHLAEYLEDMAKRDRREINSRLRQLMFHLLKWEHQPAKRSRSWLVSIITQQSDLAGAMTGTLRRHAVAEIPGLYSEAKRFAVTETGLPGSTFPTECPYTLDELLTVTPPGELPATEN